MINRSEITSAIKALLYLNSSGMRIDPIYMEKINLLVKSIEYGEPINSGLDIIYDTHGNGD